MNAPTVDIKVAVGGGGGGRDGGGGDSRGARKEYPERSLDRQL